MILMFSDLTTDFFSLGNALARPDLGLRARDGGGSVGLIMVDIFVVESVSQILKSHAITESIETKVTKAGMPQRSASIRATIPIIITIAWISKTWVLIKGEYY